MGARVATAIEAIMPVAEARGIALEATLDEDAPCVHGNADRIRQVVGNLLSDAVKFTPRGLCLGDVRPVSPGPINV